MFKVIKVSLTDKILAKTSLSFASWVTELMRELSMGITFNPKSLTGVILLTPVKPMIVPVVVPMTPSFDGNMKIIANLIVNGLKTAPIVPPSSPSTTGVAVGPTTFTNLT